MGVEQAKRAAATAARFMSAPEAQSAEPSPIEGFQTVGGLIGRSVPAAKKEPAAPSAQRKEQATIQCTAKPGVIITSQQNKLLPATV